MSFDLVKCGMCGKAAVVIEGGKRVCKECLDAERELFDEIRDFINENPEVDFTLQNTAKVLNVKESQIKHLVDSGYFKLTVKGIRLYEGPDGFS